MPKVMPWLTKRGPGEFYQIVPKGIIPNLLFRRKILKLALDEPDFQTEEWIKCSRDILYWFNTYVWTYNPKNLPKKPAVTPFLTWNFQDEAIIKIKEAIGEKDLAFEKSREMGASWIILCVFVWYWLFHPFYTFLMMSRNENLVDNGDDPDSLFWKARFVIESLPGWMQPNYNDVKLRLYNADTQSTIDGASTTKDAGRGGRRTAGLVDEFAAFPYADGYKVKRSLNDVADSWMYNSTPQGADGAFYETVQNPYIEKMHFHWSSHPVKAKGLYCSTKEGKIRILDNHYNFPENYEFITDGKLRSPWYDYQCRRRNNEMEIAQELDINYHGSDCNFFDAEILDKHIAFHANDNYKTGRLKYMIDTLEPVEFVQQESAHLKIWGEIPYGGRWDYRRNFVMGCDISQGTGASNSTFAVYDRISGNKVAEYANPHITPEKFGKLVVAHCFWFNDAFLVWEANGPGRAFGKAVIDTDYRNIYFRKTKEDSLEKKETTFPGWWSSPNEKFMTLCDYREALEFDLIQNRSKESLDECRKYMHFKDDVVAHVSSVNNEDPSGAKNNHGDRVIADALAWKGCLATKPKKPKDLPPPPNSLAGRNSWHEDQKRKQEELVDVWE